MIQAVRIFCWIVALWCALGATGQCRDYVVETVAGAGAAESNGDAGAALSINVGEPFGVEIGPDGALYITEVRNHRVRRLDLTSGELATVAGCGEKGYSGDGGPATEAMLNEPYEVRFDRHGNMYIVEMQNHVVRRVDRQMTTISTIAGTGKLGFSGDGGPAVLARFNQPHSIALDGDGAVYVADIGNHRIRRIDPKSGVIDTIAGTRERKLPQDGQVAQGNPILGPRALYIDGDTMWIALRDGHSIWRMNLADGMLHRVAGTGDAGYAGDGGPAAEAKFNGPKGIAVGPDGNVYVADTENHAIRIIDLRTGLISTIEHNNAAESSRLNRPHGICVAAGGTVYTGDTMNHRVVRFK